MPEGGGKEPFSPADQALLLIGGLVAEPLCHAGWDAIVSGEHLSRGWVGVGAGLSLGAGAASFHWWKKKLTPERRQWIDRHIPAGVVAALAIFIGYLLVPDMYSRATAPHAIQGFTQEQVDQKVGEATQPLKDQIGKLTKELDDAHKQVAGQSPLTTIGPIIGPLSLSPATPDPFSITGAPSSSPTSQKQPDLGEVRVGYDRSTGQSFLLSKSDEIRDVILDKDNTPSRLVFADYPVICTVVFKHETGPYDVAAIQAAPLSFMSNAITWAMIENGSASVKLRLYPGQVQSLLADQGNLVEYDIDFYPAKK